MTDAAKAVAPTTRPAPPGVICWSVLILISLALFWYDHAFPLFGLIVEKSGQPLGGAGNPTGYRPMLWMVAILSLFGFVFAAALRNRETGPDGHDLESPRPRAEA